MFTEIRRDYLDPSRPLLPFVLSTIGGTPAQRPIERPEGWNGHHILWVEQGEGRISVAGEERILSAGEGFFCRRGVPHSYEAAGKDFDTLWITFLGAEGVLDYYGVPDAFFFRVTPAFSASAAGLDALCAGNSTIVSRSAAGYSWLADWLAAEFAPSVTPAAQVRQFLETHFAEPLTLDEIAAHVRMNRYALCRYYAQNQGCTVMDQLKRIRLAKARQLLRYTSFPVETVGRMCGYPSPSYFGKLFREETGKTPREYREG